MAQGGCGDGLRPASRGEGTRPASQDRAGHEISGGAGVLGRALRGATSGPREGARACGRAGAGIPARCGEYCPTSGTLALPPDAPADALRDLDGLGIREGHARQGSVRFTFTQQHPPPRPPCAASDICDTDPGH